MTIGTCHCRQLKITLSSLPEYINLCDCTLCAKSGGAWGYFESADLQVEGQSKTYRRTDYERPAVEVHFCPNCGTTTHWTLTEHSQGDRVGVNMRIFPPSSVKGIEARTLDGFNWHGDGQALHRRPPGQVGKDVFL